MKKCPFCAEEIQEEAIKCRHCGEFLDKSAIKNYQENETAPNNYKCSQCQSKDVKKVSIIYESGVQIGKSEATGLGVGLGANRKLSFGIGGASIKGTTQTLLATRLAPPQKKDYPPSLSTTTPAQIIIVTSIVAIFLLITLKAAKAPATLQAASLAVLGSGIVLLIIAFVFFPSDVKEWIDQIKKENKNFRTYEKALAEWNLSWFCSHCGSIFIPEYYQKGNCTLILSNPGKRLIQIIKLVKEITGLGLKESKELVDNAPNTIKENIPYGEAILLKEQFDGLGAITELKLKEANPKNN